MENMEYKGYTIQFRSKPVPSRCMDWEWTWGGFDIDCDADSRCGFAPSQAAAMAAVDFDIEENE